MGEKTGGSDRLGGRQAMDRMTKRLVDNGTPYRQAKGMAREAALRVSGDRNAKGRSRERAQRAHNMREDRDR